jgi:2-dehydro-3-deoxyphosphogluconate aldolase / (4S)-4-hydroxy-2-oxoglutarate aldolase
MTLALPAPPLFAVLRLAGAGEATDDRLVALADGGVGAIEVAMTTPDAVELIARARALLPADVLVGAGTVMTVEQAAEVAAAGGQFLASPCLVEELAEQSLPAIPGVLTPTEIQRARRLGWSTLKLFPARVGAAYLRDLLQPLPGCEILPSGGVSVDTLAQWRNAGAAGAFLGGSAFMDGGTLLGADALRERARAARRAWDDAYASAPSNVAAASR